MSMRRIAGIVAITGIVVIGVGYALTRLGNRPGPVSVQPHQDTTGVRLVEVARGFQQPVHLTAPAGDARIFVVEQAGRVRVMQSSGAVAPRVWLDITDRVGSGGERGLLSLAFHPRFAQNGRFFVNYTDRRGDTHIAEFHADPTGVAADPSSERQLLLVRQPYANHNGGHVLFGPDGALYVGMGDGGAAADPQGNAQNDRSQLGKILRIEVGADSGRAGEFSSLRVTTWARGLRNPWRMAFDSGLLYVADVGQGSWEEIDVAPAATPGLNYGWRTMEGAHCFVNPVCSKTGLVLPAAEYNHDQGCSVTGGVVYRGRRAPALVGHYLYSDYCSGWLKSFRYVNGAATDHHSWSIRSPGQVSSFGVDGSGEVYVVGHLGTIYRIES